MQANPLTFHDEIITGTKLAKCQQCGCMHDTLKQLTQVLPELSGGPFVTVQDKLPGWLSLMKPESYSCLGCEHCYAGAAQNLLIESFPQLSNTLGLSCEIQASTSGWPIVVGEYIVLDPTAQVAVATLASLDLGAQIAEQKPHGLGIVGKLETENIGIEKLIKNVIANPNLRYLVLVGAESKGHKSGEALLALGQNGVDKDGLIIGASGKRPILRNVTQAEVSTFRDQVKIIDMIGCVDLDRINQAISNLGLADRPIVQLIPEPCGCTGDT